MVGGKATSLGGKWFCGSKFVGGQMIRYLNGLFCKYYFFRYTMSCRLFTPPLRLPSPPPQTCTQPVLGTTENWILGWIKAHKISQEGQHLTHLNQPTEVSNFISPQKDVKILRARVQVYHHPLPSHTHTHPVDP